MPAKIGAESAVRSNPDGHAILVADSSLALLSMMSSTPLRFDVLRDLEPLTRATVSPIVVAAANSAPFSTPQEMIAWAKANPGKLSVAITPGMASVTRLAFEKLKAENNFFAVPIPYAGSPAAVQAVLANDVPVVMTELNSVIPQARAGRVKVLGLLTSKRSRGEPSYATFAEAGLPKFYVDPWIGFFVPRGTPKDVSAFLSTTIREIIQMPDVEAALVGVGYEPIATSAQEASAYLANDVEYWRKLIKERKLKFD